MILISTSCHMQLDNAVVLTHHVFTTAEKGIFGLFYASKHNRVASFKNSYFSVVNLLSKFTNCTNDPRERGSLTRSWSMTQT